MRAALLFISFFCFFSDQRFNHEQAVAAVRVVAREALRDGEAELDVKLLRAGVDRADFEARDADASASEPVLDLVQHTLCDSATPVFGRDAERGDVSGREKAKERN